MSITKFIKTNKPTFDVDLKEVKQWKKAKDLLGKTIAINAIGYHMSTIASYGDSVFAIATEGYGINLPSWFKETVQEVLKDDESIEQIKSGLVGIKLTPYKTKNGTSTVNIEFVELGINNDDLPY